MIPVILKSLEQFLKYLLQNENLLAKLKKELKSNFQKAGSGELPKNLENYLLLSTLK